MEIGYVLPLYESDSCSDVEKTSFQYCITIVEVTIAKTVDSVLSILTMDVPPLDS